MKKLSSLTLEALLRIVEQEDDRVLKDFLPSDLDPENLKHDSYSDSVVSGSGSLQVQTLTRQGWVSIAHS